MKQSKLDRIQKDFENHVLTVEIETDNLKVYWFKRPDSFDLAQRWVFMGNKLVVVGDCYDSIYSGGPFRSIEEAARCNLSYFSEKCSADRDGHYQSKFDSEAATESIHEAIVCQFEDEDIFEEGDELETKLSAIETYIDETTDEYHTEIPRYFEDEYETVIWLRNNPHFVGCDWWDGLSLNKKNRHPYWHLAAIKEAAKQLSQSATAKVA